MKKKYQFRKELQEIAKTIGLGNAPVLATLEKPHTKQLYFQLVNNNKRFVKSVLSLPIEEQRLRLSLLKQKINEAALEKAAFDAKQSEVKDGNIDGQ